VTLIDEETEALAIPLVEITGPGVYDMPADQYHRRPELSSSGMRKLLAPGCPALYHWEQLNPPEPKDEFDFGHVAHKLVLGEGEQVQVLDFDSYRTADARAAKLQAYRDGMIPILEREFLKAKAMALEVRKHPKAKALFAYGKPEQSLFWRDAATGTDMKARVDWLREPREGRRLKLVDYKTATKVDPESIRRAIAEHCYHQQGATYREAAMALGIGGEDTVVLLIFQEKTAPFLVHVAQLTPYDLQLGAARNRRAIQIYRECMESGEWPAYPEVSHIEMPAWAQTRDELEYRP
jgi:hypothetical protein